MNNPERFPVIIELTRKEIDTLTEIVNDRRQQLIDRIGPGGDKHLTWQSEKELIEHYVRASINWALSPRE